MDNTNDILGYVACHTCMTPKAIKQCKGKRSNFVMGNCDCGADQRCGKAAQAELKAFKPLEQVQAELEARSNPKAEAKPEPQMVVPEPVAELVEPEPTITEPKTEPKPVAPEPKPEPKTDGISTASCVGLGAIAGLIFGGIIKTMRAVA